MSTFDKQLDRPAMVSEKTLSPNETRFVTIKVPKKSNMSPAINFEKMSNRDKGNIYSSVQYQAEYDNAREVKDSIMKNLNIGVLRMDRGPNREIGQGFGGYIPRS